MASVLLVVVLGLSVSGCDPREWFVCSLGLCGYEFDDVAPQRPAGLVATPGDARVSLSWTASPEPDAVFYDIVRATTPGGPSIDVATTFDPGLLDTYLLTNGVTYYYRVSVRDGAGNESPQSFEVSATPSLVVTPPRPRLAAPVLTAEGEFLNGISLEWSEVAGAHRYRLLRGTARGGPYDLIEDTIVNFHRDRDVASGTAYYYVVVAVDSGGQLGDYSAEVSASQHFNPGPPLNFLTTWGSRGMMAGAFWNPRGIAVDDAGSVYVTDNTPEVARVQKFTSAGVFVTAWFVGPAAHGVAVDGDVFVVNPAQDRVQKYTAGGTFIAQWSGGLTAPTGIAADGLGSVYVADAGRVVKFTTAGVFVREWPVAGAVGVATDAAGSVYVVGANRVSKFTGDGVAVLDFGDGLTAPEGIGVDASGRVMVADTGNDRIQIYTTAGVFAVGFGSSGSATSQFEAPNAVAGDCRSNLYVLDAGNSRVKKYGADAAAVCPAPAPAPGGLASAAAVAARPGFVASMTTAASTRGKVSAAGGLTRERGAGARGGFRGRLVGRATASTRAFRAYSRGVWRARFDIVSDPVSKSSTAKGVALITPSRRRGGVGQLCLGFSLKVSVVGTKATARGTFETLGGSGASRTLRARGSFSQALGKTATFTLRGTGAPGRGAGRPLPAACRRLR